MESVSLANPSVSPAAGGVHSPALGDLTNGVVFWDYVTRLEEETRRLVRCYCSKEMNEEFPACTDKDCNDLIRLNQELRRDMERYLSI